MIRTGTFRYVPYAKVDDYHKRGWMIVADLDSHHAYYSVLMWRCDCDDGS